MKVLSVLALSLMPFAMSAMAAPKERTYVTAEFYGDSFEKDGLACNGTGDVDRSGDVTVYERCHDHYIHLYKLRVGDVVYILSGSEALIGTLKGTQVSMRFSKNYRTVYVVTRYGKEARYYLMPGTFHVK